MKSANSPDERERVRCAYAWCVTDHGRTVHPDDEDHRSAGSGFAARVRDGSSLGCGEITDLEIGVLRRRGDAETWISIESGAGVSLALPLVDARALACRLGRELADAGAPLEPGSTGASAATARAGTHRGGAGELSPR
jgi:hypothetical protein